MANTPPQHPQRKDEHIHLCRTQDVENSQKRNGFEQLNFIPCALSELNIDDIDASTKFLNHIFDLPLLITGMTGGTAEGERINQNLAIAAQKYQIPMGVGSQRIALESVENAKIFQVRKWAPDIYLIANLGISQLIDSDCTQKALDAIEMIEANALAIHINIMQELVQFEGDRNFRGIHQSIQTIKNKLKFPIIIKEVGCGMDEESLKSLFEIGVDAVDIGGSGGTSWTYIEGLRSSTQSHLGEMLRDWGIPTANSLAAARLLQQKCQSKTQLIATGGIRSGLDIAKALAIGANICGIGLPFFKAALQSSEHVMKTIEDFTEQLHVVMLGTNSKSIDQLTNKICMGTPYHEKLLSLVNSPK